MTRMQRKRLLLVSRRMWLLNLLVVVLLTSSVYVYWNTRTVPAMAVQTSDYSVMHMFSWKEILNWTIPGLSGDGQVDAVKQEGRSVYPFIYDMIDFFTNVKSNDLKSVLTAEMPCLAMSAVPTANVKPKTEALFPKAVMGELFADGKPLVGIYHTHTAESFIPSTGVAHRPGGQLGEICEVGNALVESLQSHGIVALQDTTIHDYPSFMKAYGASEVTVTRMVKENPSLQMVFDIHRDAEKRENVIGDINGMPVAKLSIIVAKGQADLPQPHWQKNYALAKLIDQKCNEKYPGLLRGIQLVDWRYNQHLHDHALLLEVGSHETSTEEGVNAMRLLGEILNDILRSGIDNQ